MEEKKKIALRNSQQSLLNKLIPHTKSHLRGINISVGGHLNYYRGLTKKGELVLFSPSSLPHTIFTELRISE